MKQVKQEMEEKISKLRSQLNETEIRKALTKTVSKDGMDLQSIKFMLSLGALNVTSNIVPRFGAVGLMGICRLILAMEDRSDQGDKVARTKRLDTVLNKAAEDFIDNINAHPLSEKEIEEEIIQAKADQALAAGAGAEA